MTQIADRRDRAKLQTEVYKPHLLQKGLGIPLKIWTTFIKSCALHKPVLDADNLVVLYIDTVATLEI